jgi:CHASE1-domain containing sensor protein
VVVAADRGVRPWRRTFLPGLAIGAARRPKIGAGRIRLPCQRYRYPHREPAACHLQSLEDAAGLIEQSPRLTREDFHDYVAGLRLDTNFPGTQGIGYLALISRAQLPDFLREMQGRGGHGFEIPYVRDHYGPVVYLEPFVGTNKRFIGFDLFAEPVRHQSLLKAWQDGVTTISGKLVLVHDLDRGKVPGMLISTPIYRRGQAVDSLAQRRAHMLGWVAAPLSVRPASASD